MLYLGTDSLVIEKAKKEFYSSLLPLIKKRIRRFRNNAASEFFRNVTDEDLRCLLIGKPAELIELHEIINPFLKDHFELKNAVGEVFNYDEFIKKSGTGKYDAYSLASSLKQTCCVYCNRNYVNTVITREGKKISRPQFDHYFDQGKHPLLALSFYNLIPSCSTCNASVKLGKEFALNTHIHPYVDDAEHLFTFTYKYDNKETDGLKIVLHTSGKAKKYAEDLALEPVYQLHTDLLSDLIRKRYAFSDNYLNILKNNVLRGVLLSDKELYRLAFGTELEKRSFNKRPFSKFNFDILQELGIID